MSYIAELRRSGALADENKLALEHALKASPRSEALREEYFDFLRELSRRRFGLLTARLPELDHPLFMRANTSDVLNLRRVFLKQEYSLPVGFDVEAVIDLGAYCGYTTVFFANRFKHASVLSVEPSEQNFRILSLNAAPYENIRILNGAVWNRASVLTLKDRLGGHWGTRFAEDAPSGGDEVQAYALSDLLDLTGRSVADFIKCDIEGAEVEVFSDPEARRIVHQAKVVTVETHDRFREESSSTVLGAMPEGLFSRTVHGDHHLFLNRDPAVLGRKALRPSEKPLLRSEGPVVHVNVGHVNPAPWGIMAIDETTLQLHPNVHGQPAAEMSLTVRGCRGKWLRTGCRTDGHGSQDVVYTVLAKIGREVFDQASRRLPHGVFEEMAVRLPEDVDAVVLTFQTEMAPQTSGNGGSWARWVNPRLTDS